MSKIEFVKEDLAQMDPNTGETTLRVEYEGHSQMPFWNDDLKVKVILSLLNTIDYKNYAENNMHLEAEQDANEIIEAAKVAFGLK